MGEGSEFQKWLKIVIKQRKEQKQAVTKGKANIDTDAH